MPTRPTKTSDSRSRNFVGESVEVDAIPTGILRRIVENKILQHVDQDALETTLMVEKSEREGLLAMARGWSA